ncbi:MAG: nucleotide exchange factor GrpE [Phenylobacterium sp.]|uniref:nucleotide exchange factor GrpE n=1 Tax=Phenylobacterium sp. TaxID=1871053 RepID=UPI00391CAC2E
MTDDHTPADEETEATAEAALETLEALRAENAALREQVLRVAADAENAKRRAEREANDARAYAIQKFARDLLGVADNLSRALAAQPGGEADAAVKNFVVGVEMTEKALQTAFEQNGLKKVDPAKGEKFDPHLHQAVMEQPSDEVAGGGVIQTLQAGYELFGRIVRPAMVAVAAKGSGPAPQADGSGNPYDADGDGSGASVDRRA